MKMLVTGGAGFVGSHITEHFIKKGWDVSVFDNLSRSNVYKQNAVKNFNWIYLSKKYPKVNLIVGDVINYTDLISVSKDIDVIIHTAGQVAVTTSLKQPRVDFSTNVIGTFNVLEIAREMGCDVLFCSTNKVYGENVNKIPVKRESSGYQFSDKLYSKGIPENFSLDLCKHSPYGCSKLASDLYVQEYSHTYGLKTGVFRMSCIYGERQFGVEDQGWVAWFILASMLNLPITIYGDGYQVRDVLFISDLIQIFENFITSGIISNVFNVGGGTNNILSLNGLLKLIEQISGKKTMVSFSDWRQADQKVYISDITKIKTLLNWEPKISPEEGVTKIINWIKENFDLFSRNALF